MKYHPEVKICWRINEDSAKGLMEDYFSIPTIDHFKERLIINEAENKKLSRNERKFKKLVYAESEKVVND